MRITNQAFLAPDPGQPAADASTAADIEADFWRELKELETEAMGWKALGPGSYWHTGSGDDNTVEIVGLPSAGMAGAHMLWLF